MLRHWFGENAVCAPCRLLNGRKLGVWSCEYTVGMIQAPSAHLSFTGTRIACWLQRDQGNNQQANRPVLPCCPGGILVTGRGRGARAAFVEAGREAFIEHVEICPSVSQKLSINLMPRLFVSIEPTLGPESLHTP